MEEPIRTEFYRGVKINIYPDDMEDRPRDWDNLGTMVCSHRQYNLGDVQLDASADGYQAFYDHLNEKFEITYNYDYTYLEDHENKIIERWIDKNLITLPLYLYDHSGIAINTYGYSCPWDSGQAGFIYVDLDTIRKEYKVKRISKKLREQVRRVLISEVETYDTYIRGNVIGYRAENLRGEDMGSCWGFYSLEALMECAMEEIDYNLRAIVKKAKDRRAAINHELVRENIKQEACLCC